MITKFHDYELSTFMTTNFVGYSAETQVVIFILPIILFVSHYVKRDFT